MSKIRVQKRGNVFQYRFEIASVGRKRKYINKSGFKTRIKLMMQVRRHIINI